MKTLAQCPVRLGLGGGGSDIDSYFEKYGGAVLNTTIDHYVYCEISSSNCGIICSSIDKSIIENSSTKNKLLILHWETINYFIINYKINIKGILLQSYTDIPIGSGLGTSSALVVCMVKAISHHFNIKLNKTQLIFISYTIERLRCSLSGGYQDYISGVYGGINFIEFKKNKKFIVKPVKIPYFKKREFEYRCTLVFTGKSRLSNKIINDQQNAIKFKNKLLAMHEVKNKAYLLRDSLKAGDLNKFADLLMESYLAKKATSKSITTTEISYLEKQLTINGAQSMKISGAGGGGFLFILSKEHEALSLKSYIKKNYVYRNLKFTDEKVEAWTIR